MVIGQPGIIWDPREPIPPALRRRLRQGVDNSARHRLHDPQRVQDDGRYRYRARPEEMRHGYDGPNGWGPTWSDQWTNLSHQQNYINPQSAPRRPVDEVYVEEYAQDRPTEGFLAPVSMSVNTQIIQDTAKVSVTQLFFNNTSNCIPKASYTFPLPPGSTVVDFSCRVGSNKILKGKVKPKDEAHETFNEAARQNQTAGLLDQNTPEVFTTTLGNIPADTKLKVEMFFVVLLKYGFSDGAGLTTFTLPLYIAPRYGNPGEGLQQALASTSGLRSFSMEVAVLAPERILSITSSSHNVDVEIGVAVRNCQSWREFAETGHQVDPRTALVKLPEDTTHLDKDFVLKIRTQPASGLEHPQACIETHPSLENHQAVMLTIPPKFMLQSQTETHDAEIIFIADRSGSMSDKIQALKSSMGFFLKGIPESCTFNIWCFGSRFESLWPGSKQYTDASLQTALSYVSREFASNMGGTQLLPVLKAALGTRGGFHSTDVVVLTDGQVWDLDDTIRLVEQTRNSSEGRVRFFSLGIGDNVSHELVESIAKVGGGYAEVIPTANQGGWESRVVAVLSAALAGHIGPLRIELEHQSEVNGQGPVLEDVPMMDADTEQQNLRKKENQSPADTATLSPFLRNRVFLLFENTRLISTPLLGIHIKTTRPGGEEISVYVPLKVLEIRDSTIHKLGARALLGDLERGQSHVHLGPDAPQRGSASERQLVRAEGERLGCKWSLVSKWTSFVAVEEPFVPAEGTQDAFMDAGNPQIERVDQGDLDLLRPRGGARGNTGAVLVGAAGTLEEDTENDDDSDDSNSESSLPGGGHRSDDDGDDDEDGSAHGDGGHSFNQGPSQPDSNNQGGNTDNSPAPGAAGDPSFPSFNAGYAPTTYSASHPMHAVARVISTRTLSPFPPPPLPHPGDSISRSNNSPHFQWHDFKRNSAKRKLSGKTSGVKRSYRLLKEPVKSKTARHIAPSVLQDLASESLRDSSTVPNNNLPASSAMLETERSVAKSEEDRAKEDLVRKILTFQQYDGAIDWEPPYGLADISPRLQDILGTGFETAVQTLEAKILALLEPTGRAAIAQRIALTAAVKVLLEKQFSTCRALWLRMSEKAVDFIKQNNTISVPEILVLASTHVSEVQIPLNITAERAAVDNDPMRISAITAPVGFEWYPDASTIGTQRAWTQTPNVPAQPSVPSFSNWAAWTQTPSVPAQPPAPILGNWTTWTQTPAVPAQTSAQSHEFVDDRLQEAENTNLRGEPPLAAGTTKTASLPHQAPAVLFQLQNQPSATMEEFEPSPVDGIPRTWSGAGFLASQESLPTSLGTEPGNGNQTSGPVLLDVAPILD